MKKVEQSKILKKLILLNKAFKQFPNSKAQLKTRKKIKSL